MITKIPNDGRKTEFKVGTILRDPQSGLALRIVQINGDIATCERYVP